MLSALIMCFAVFAAALFLTLAVKSLWRILRHAFIREAEAAEVDSALQNMNADCSAADTAAACTKAPPSV